MARLEGTGKDPLGRYGKGEVFDVPKTIGLADDPQPNPAYQELLDNGYAKEVAPEDDPGRTTTQIADAKASRMDPLSHPVDAALAADMTVNDALAVVHSGDPNATASDDLKTDAIRESQSEDASQVGRSPAFMGQKLEEDEAATATAEPQAGTSKPSTTSSAKAPAGSQSGNA